MELVGFIGVFVFPSVCLPQERKIGLQQFFTFSGQRFGEGASLCLFTLVFRGLGQAEVMPLQNGRASGRAHSANVWVEQGLLADEACVRFCPGSVWLGWASIQLEEEQHFHSASGFGVF